MFWLKSTVRGVNFCRIDNNGLLYNIYFLTCWSPSKNWKNTTTSSSKGIETHLRGYLARISSRRALNDVIYDRWEFRAGSSEDREPKATRFTPLQLHIFHRVGHLSIGLSGSSSAPYSPQWLTSHSPEKIKLSDYRNFTLILRWLL